MRSVAKYALQGASSKYARRLLDVGEMMWSTLTYFQHVLDPTRGDPFDGSLRYFPEEGLKLLSLSVEVAQTMLKFALRVMEASSW